MVLNGESEMAQISISEWFRARKELNFEDFKATNIDGDEVTFQTMALTKDAIEMIQLEEDYSEALTLAAEKGVAYYRKRVCDDPELALDFQVLWEDPLLETSAEPSIKHQVGLFVCRQNGLEEYIEEIKPKIEVDGDAKTPDFDLDMHEIAEAAAHPANA